MNRSFRMLSMISYGSPSYPWEEHGKSSFSQSGDQKIGSEKVSGVPKVLWQAYTWDTSTPLHFDFWVGAILCFITCLWSQICVIYADMDFFFCIQIEQLEEWYLFTNSHRALKWGKLCEPGIFSNYKWEMWSWEGNWHESVSISALGRKDQIIPSFLFFN